MTIEVEIDKKANLRKHKVTGILTLDALQNKLREIYEEPDYNPDMDVLWDLREADLSSFEADDVDKLSDMVSKFWGTEGKSRAALVVSKDLDYGLSRMYEMLLENRISSIVRIFREIDAALEWIERR
jgi:hypothetical protein